VECRAGRHARGAAPKLRVQFGIRAHTISFHFVPQVKNFVTAIVKLYKGVDMPANRVANRQAASAARSATSQLAQLAAAAAAAGSQAESVQRAQPPPALSATAPAAPAGSASPGPLKCRLARRTMAIWLVTLRWSPSARPASIAPRR